MSTPSKPDILTRRTTANLTASPFRLVKPNGDDDTALCGGAGVAGGPPLGSLTNDTADGSSTAVYLPVQVGGIILVKCAGVITAGQPAMSNAGSQAVLGTDGNWIFGYALETHAAGDIGAFIWAPSFFETTV